MMSKLPYVLGVVDAVRGPKHRDVVGAEAALAERAVFHRLDESVGVDPKLAAVELQLRHHPVNVPVPDREVSHQLPKLVRFEDLLFQPPAGKERDGGRGKLGTGRVPGLGMSTLRTCSHMQAYARR